MAADTPKRLYGPNGLSATAADIYEAPASVTATIIKNVHLVNIDAATAYKATLSIGDDAAPTRILPAVSIPANSVYDWDTWLVLGPSERLQGYADTANKITITINGIEITA